MRVGLVHHGIVEVVIRELLPTDSIEELTVLINRAYAELMDQGWNMTGCYQDAQITKERTETGPCLVGVMDGRLVATGQLGLKMSEYDPEFYQREDVAVFGQFAVDPDLRRLKIGDAIIKKAEEKAVELGYSVMALDTIETADFLVEYYHRRGFRIVGTTQWRDKTYRSVLMAKQIGVTNA